MNPRHPLIAVALFLAALCGWSQGTFVYDQQSSVEGGYLEGGISDIQGAQIVGESFTPSLSSVGFIRIVIYDSSFAHNTPGTLYVNLRSGSISGPVLSSTEPVTIQPRLGGPTDFVFAAPVPVTPRETYFFQPVVQSGDRWGLFVGQYSYPQGMLFTQGTPAPDFDFWFREGIIIPEPSSATLLLLGGGVLAWLRQRHRRFHPSFANTSHPSSTNVSLKPGSTPLSSGLCGNAVMEASPLARTGGPLGRFGLSC